MIGLGTLINTTAILIGGIVGLVFGKRISDRFQQTITTGIGVCVLFIGIAGAMEKMLVFENGSLSSRGSMMLIVSMALGAITGELLDIDGKMERFGRYLKTKTGSEKDAKFVDGFVSTSFTVCIGAMAVVGAIQDGIYKDPSTLIAKSALDLIILVIMTASMGKGCIFSAIPVFVLQGTVTLAAKLIEPVLTDAALSNLSLVGSVLIFCVGLNLIWQNKVKVANLLPAIIWAVAYAFLPF